MSGVPASRVAVSPSARQVALAGRSSQTVAARFESVGVTYTNILIAAGLATVVLFYRGAYYPIWLSAVIFVLVTAFMVHQVIGQRVGVLMLLLWVVYALPFIHIGGYVTYDFDEASTAKLFKFWQYYPNEYMLDQTVIQIMSMIGATGALGFCLGVQLNAGRLTRPTDLKISPRVLPIPTFIALLLIAIALAWVRAPRETILQARYGSSTAVSDTWNFSSAWFFSACLIVLCFIDSILDHTLRAKLVMTIAAALFSLIWLNLLRGDREALTMGFALILIYFYWGKRLPGTALGSTRINWKAVFLFGVPLFYAQLVVSATRDSIAGLNASEIAEVVGDLYDEGVFSPINAIHGTWSAALATPLSVAGDYFHGVLPIRYGQSYLDLVRSIVPGFVANWVGYVRPLDNQGDLAWAMTYGIGGIHAVVMPFYDFRIIGVFVVICGWSFVCSRIESAAIDFNRLCLLAMIAVAAPWWLWYGEKSIMNAVIIWWLLTRLYRFLALERPLHLSGRTMRARA